MPDLRSCTVWAAVAFVSVVASGALAETAAPATRDGGETVEAMRDAGKGRRTHRLVYSCRDGSIPMFSDRPCGETALLRSLDVYTPPPGGRPPTTVADPPRASTRPAQRDRQERALQQAAEKCERLQNALDEIDDRMRAGYPARQAAQIWQRWRDARAAVRDAGC